MQGKHFTRVLLLLIPFSAYDTSGSIKLKQSNNTIHLCPREKLYILRVSDSYYPLKHSRSAWDHLLVAR